MSIINYVILSDIHFKALDNEQLITELMQVTEQMEQMEKLDLIAITGDYFHKKIDSDRDVKIALRFMYHLIQIAKEKNAKIRVIKGTHSHDLNQLDMFKGLDDVSSVDLRVIDTVSNEYLFPNFNVLYIPEEYMANQEEYYADWIYSKTDEYSMILGHGMVDVGAFYAQKQESEETKSQAPVFKVNDLINACPTGPIYFGHIHTPIQHENFRYVGSFTVWAFGEEEAKGYYVGVCNSSTGEFEDTFMENKLRKRFNTMVIPEDYFIFQIGDPYQLMEKLVELVDNDPTSDYIRIKITIPADYEHAMLLGQLIENTFNSHKRVTSTLITSVMREKKQKEVKKQIDELVHEYGYLFSSDMDVYEKIAHHIKKKWGINIKVEKIISLLTRN